MPRARAIACTCRDKSSGIVVRSVAILALFAIARFRGLRLLGSDPERTIDRMWVVGKAAFRSAIGA
jgi:hypothetical protein